MKDAKLNLAPIVIKGRYPASGYTSNTLSDSIVHVIKGYGMLTLKDGTTASLLENDQVHLAVGDEYYFEGTDMFIVYAATPPWTPEQTQQST